MPQAADISSIGPFRRLIARYRESHDVRETIATFVVWGVVLAYIPLSHLFDYWNDSRATSVDWTGIGSEYLSLLPFFALFLFNDIVLARILVRHQKVLLYVITAVASALLMTFAIEIFRSPEAETGRPMEDPGAPWGRERLDDGARRGDAPPARPGDSDWDESEDRPTPPDMPDGMQNNDRPDDFRPDGRPPEPRDIDSRGRGAGEFAPPAKPDEINRRTMRLGPMMSDFVLAVMMVCLSMFTKLYLLSDRDKERMRQLAKERTEAELAQLRYQLSPHFMMNTLNNIHALVDIDPERAKETIERMSRLMRYMLYESGKATTPLKSEVEFLCDYVELMSIRYTDAVAISLQLPEETYGIALPPLLFINMVENAFKHGVSYSRTSFVDISLSIAEDHRTVNFCCTNSLGPERPADTQHGIGVENTRRRLDLLCSGHYQLSSMKLADRYVATLQLRL